jgi:hypothetical protein
MLASACIPDLPVEEVVLDTRPIAARVEVAGEPARAWPLPGETASVTWLVVDPTDAKPIGWAFFVCPAFVTPSGESFCSGAPFAIALQEEAVDEDPVVTFTIPSEETLAGASEVLMLGVICPDGTPVLDLAAQDVRCDGSDEPRTLVQFTITVATGSDPPNQNPLLPDDALSFGGMPWPRPAAEPPATGCAAMAGTDELPLRTAPVEVDEDDPLSVDVTIRGDEASRETYVGFDDVERREDLVYQVFASHGAPERLYTVLDDEQPEGTLAWELPAAAGIDPTGTLVRFWIVLLDQRGGTVWSERFACLVP